MLPVQEAVVGREDDERPRQLTLLLERRDDPADGLVYREKRLEPQLVALGDRGDLLVTERRPRANRAGLVRDVLLVERRRRGQRGGGEAADVPRGGQRRQGGAAGSRRPADVRGEEREPQEERLAGGRAAAHDLDGLVGVDVRLVRRRIPAVLYELPVLVHGVAVELVGGVVDRAVPLRPARRDLVLVEVAVPVQVLADEDRLVARALEPHG